MSPRVAAMLNQIEDTLYRKSRLLVRDADNDDLILVVDASVIRDVIRDALERHAGIGG